MRLRPSSKKLPAQKDAVNFLVVLGGVFYVPCSFFVAPLIQRFGVRRVTIGNSFLILLAVAARLLATGPETYHWIVVGQSHSPRWNSTVQQHDFSPHASAAKNVVEFRRGRGDQAVFTAYMNDAVRKHVDLSATGHC